MWSRRCDVSKSHDTYMFDSHGTFGLWGGSFYSFGVANRPLGGRGVLVLLRRVYGILVLHMSLMAQKSMHYTELPYCVIGRGVLLMEVLIEITLLMFLVNYSIGVLTT